MARPVNANPEETRRRIIEAAVTGFASDGFHGVSTRTLAREARVNIATISYYFGNKQGLYEAAVDEVYKRLQALGQEVLPTLPKLSFHDMIARVYRAAREQRQGIRLLVREVLDLGRLAERTQKQHYLPALDQYSALASGMFGVTPERARMTFVTISYLLTRYCIQDDESLRNAFGVTSDEDAHRSAVESIVLTAAAHLGKTPEEIRFPGAS